MPSSDANDLSSSESDFDIPAMDLDFLVADASAHDDSLNLNHNVVAPGSNSNVASGCRAAGIPEDQITGCYVAGGDVARAFLSKSCAFVVICFCNLPVNIARRWPRS